MKTKVEFLRKSAFYSLFILSALLYIPSLNSPSVIPKLIAIGLIAPLLIYQSKITPLMLLVSFFALWKLSSYFVAVSKVVYFHDIVFLIVALICYFALKSFLKAKNYFDVVLLLTVSSLIISMIGIFQYFGFIPHLFNQRAAPAAMFVNKNFASPYIVFSFWWIFLYFLKNRNYFLIPLISIDLFYLILSATRSSWLAFIIAFFIFFIFGILRLRDLYRRFFIGIFTIVLLLLVFLITTKFKPDSVKVHRDFRAQADSILSVNKSARVRLLRWQNSTAIMKKHPFVGVGAGNYDVVYPLYHKAVVYDKFYSSHFFEGGAHNEYIQLICENGFPAFLLLIGILVLFFKYLFLGIKTNFYLTLSIIFSSISLLIISFFSSIMHHPTYIFLALMNLSFADIFFKKPITKIPKIIHYLILGLFFLFIFISYRIYNSERYFKKSNLAFYNSDYKNAWEYGRKAVKSWKYNPELLFNLTNYGYTYFLYHHEIYGKINVIADEALSVLPYHFMPNFAKGLLLRWTRNKEIIKEYLQRKEILLEITPQKKESDMKKNIEALEKKYEKS